jgi:hypothetical protein
MEIQGKIAFTLFPRSEERVGKRSDAGVSKIAALEIKAKHLWQQQ